MRPLRPLRIIDGFQESMMNIRRRPRLIGNPLKDDPRLAPRVRRHIDRAGRGQPMPAALPALIAASLILGLVVLGAGDAALAAKPSPLAGATPMTDFNSIPLRPEAPRATPCIAPPRPTAKKALQIKFAMSCHREQFDFTIAKIAAEIGIPIEFIERDLQQEGIKRRQTYDLNEPEQTLDELLRIIFLKINPDGKLVYQIKSKEPGGPDVIFVTTRSAVEKRGEKLPDVFAAPPKK